MKMMRGVKRLSRKLIIRQMLQMLPRLSMNNIVRIIDLGERLLNREDYREVAGSMKKYIRQGHPAVKVIERVLHELAPGSMASTVRFSGRRYAAAVCRISSGVTASNCSSRPLISSGLSSNSA